MGTNSKSSHQAYITEPTSAADGEEGAPVESPPSYQNALYLAFGQGAGEGFIDPEDDPVGWYQAFAPAAAQAMADAKWLDAQYGTDYVPMVKALTVQALGELSAEQLQAIAAAEGFEHPALVGMTKSAVHPLVHWLDPAYPEGIKSKQKIQFVAQARYDELVAGGTVGGMTLADLQAIEGVAKPAAPAAPSPAPGDGAAEVLSALGAISEAAAAYEKVKGHHGDAAHAQPHLGQAQALLALIDAENKLADTVTPELAAQMPGIEGVVAGARQNVTSALQGTQPPNFKYSHNGVQAAKAEEFYGALAEHPESTPASALLDWNSQIALLRHTTPAEQRDHLQETAAWRAELATHLADGRTALTEIYQPNEHSFDLPQDPAKLPAAIDKLGAVATDYYAAAAKGGNLAKYNGVSPAAVEKVAPGALEKVPDVQTLTKDFRTYAKGLSMATLRETASAAGLEHTEAATRAQLQNYLAAGWDKSLDRKEISASVNNAHLAKNPEPASALAAAASTPPATSGAGKSPAAPTPAKKATPVKGAAAPAVKAAAAPAAGFGAQRKNLVAALAQAGAAHAALPERLPVAEVKKLTFGPGKSAKIGGHHVMNLHQGSDGGTWLVKPDDTPGKWRVSADAGGSVGYAAGGLAAIPVYARNVDGKLSSVQPLIKGTTPFPEQPSSWSQADVDHLVRCQVGAWMIGDHDSKPGNLLRTEGGGLIPCDYGASFKHYGQDKLAVDYQPMEVQTAFQTLVKSHKSGGLAAGVSVNPLAAHAVIKKYEQMPDAQWRSLLHETAHRGAAGDAPWTATMRKRAAKALDLHPSQVTTEQTAEAFLDYAVERKAQLRSTFAEFFTKAGFQAGSHLKTLGS